jgi:integrase
MNPLSLLPNSYSGYDRNARDVLKAEGIDIPVDVERNRRVDREGEEARIVAFLERQLSASTTDVERAEIEGMICMFRLVLETCMRMREVYTLTIDQIRPECASIFLIKTKNGDNREVPLGIRALDPVRRSWPACSRFESRVARALDSRAL